jgi:hypothetical protein
LSSTIRFAIALTIRNTFRLIAWTTDEITGGIKEFKSTSITLAVMPLAQTSPAADNGNVDNGDGGRVGMALGMFVGSPVLETVGDLLGDSLVESIGVVGARVGAVVGNLDGAAANGTKLGGSYI